MSFYKYSQSFLPSSSREMAFEDSRSSGRDLEIVRVDNPTLATSTKQSEVILGGKHLEMTK